MLVYPDKFLEIELLCQKMQACGDLAQWHKLWTGKCKDMSLFLYQKIKNKKDRYSWTWAVTLSQSKPLTLDLMKSFRSSAP